MSTTDVQEGNVSLGSVLKKARDDARLTRVQLGKATGLSPRTIEKYEYDAMEPTVGNLKKLCIALGISYDDVMAEVEAPGVTPSIAPKPKRGTSASDTDGDASTGDIRKQLAAIHGKLDALSPLPAAADKSAASTESPAAAALFDLRDLVDHKGRKPEPGYERQRAAKIKAALVEMEHLDYADLLALGKEIDYPDLDKLPSVSDLDELSTDEQNATLAELCDHYIFAQLYPRFWDYTPKQMAKLCQDFDAHRGDYDPEHAIPESYIFESTKAFAERLQKDLPRSMVDAAKDAQPLPAAPLAVTGSGSKDED